MQQALRQGEPLDAAVVPLARLRPAQDAQLLKISLQRPGVRGQAAVPQAGDRQAEERLREGDVRDAGDGPEKDDPVLLAAELQFPVVRSADGLDSRRLLLWVL